MEKAHSCMIRAAYVKGRRARHWLPPPPARNTDIADILHLPRLHSPIAMAGRTEVPDSEDEPMTSSPVNILDGAADKLCAAAPVSLEDAQDALHDVTKQTLITLPIRMPSALMVQIAKMLHSTSRRRESITLTYSLT
jgi:hypothetical protein